MQTPNTRRSFLELSTAALIAVPAWAQSTKGPPKSASKKAGEEDVDPPEDLMREHGLLNRVLLIYEEGIRRIESKQDFLPASLGQAAAVIRTFIENYHEKLEEDHLFPRFRKAGKLVQLVDTLQAQHVAGRQLTAQIESLAGKAASRADQDAMRQAMETFIRMYRPHEAREDTVLFPALRSIVSEHEFDAMGEDFEKKEHELFGKEGFEGEVEKVAGIERQFGIYDLAKFTPSGANGSQVR